MPFIKPNAVDIMTTNLIQCRNCVYWKEGIESPGRGLCNGLIKEADATEVATTGWAFGENELITTFNFGCMHFSSEGIYVDDKD